MKELMDDYIASHTKEDNINGINAIIEILESIRKTKNIGRYLITAKIKKYCMHDHTKGNIVKTTQIGSKIEITISEGTQENIEKTMVGDFIIDEE